MKQWIKQIQFVKQIASHLLSPRKSNYHDDFLLYKLSKNIHLSHKNFKTQNQFNELLNATIIKHKQQQNDTCVIFLHGYGSNKQEGFTLIDCLPKQLDLCCFDFSSSGKSQGNITAYGLKQFRDIRAIISRLKTQQFRYKRFILWGRSMGAVASFLMVCSQQNTDKNLQKDIIFQVLDSPFSSFESICSYQGKQSFKLPEPFISFGIQILKSHFKDKEQHSNPFNIDLIKVSEKCDTGTLFVYSELDDMIPKENTLSIIQKLPSLTIYEKLLIEENHNTLRSNQTNQEIFKIITKNYLKLLYNLQKNQSSKSKAQKEQTNFDSKLSPNEMTKTQSFIHIHRKNLTSTIHFQSITTQETIGSCNRIQPIKKQKKFLELLSTAKNNKKKTSKAAPKQIKPINIDIEQFYSFRNPTSSKGNTITYESIKKKVSQDLNDCTDAYEHKNTMNSINSFKDIHKLRRSNTFNFPQDNESVQKVNNAQSLQKTRNFVSSSSTAMKTDNMQASLKISMKMKKRALYCSLNKNPLPNKTGFKFLNNSSKAYIQLQNNNAEQEG